MTDAGPYWGNSNIVPRNISREWEDIHRERDELRAEVERLKRDNETLAMLQRNQAERIDYEVARVEQLRAALRQILEDPEALILNSHRDDGWAALCR